ncbi:MAG: hypothetical protein WCO12_01645 [bacterium]
MLEENPKAYIVAVDMGYGHQRAVFPLEHIAALPEGWENLPSAIISANTYPGIPESDKRSWKGTRTLYEWISRMRTVPFIGPVLFGAMNYFQRIEPFYPKRDLSKPTLQVKQIYRMIEKGFGKDLIEKLNEKPLPLITSFFITAFFAEEHEYEGDIYCLCTDTDISRAWVPFYPKESRIIYLAPTQRVKDRLLLYGVRPEKVILTGFPLPKELLGGESDLQVLKRTLSRRIVKLDPQKNYEEKYKALVSKYLEEDTDYEGSISLMFAIGGAGAQLDVGINIITSLRSHIESNKIKLNLVAGTSLYVYETFKKKIEELGLLESYKNGSISILYNPEKFEYFREFSALLLETDILWTKPSELSFYAGLGLPIIIAPPLGSQEEFNRAWLYSVEAGIDQEDPRYVSEWLFSWISNGRFAEAAMNGFLNSPKRGVYHIEDLVLRGEKKEIEHIHSL